MATIKRRPGTGRWQVRYRDPAGRSRSRTYARKVDAQRFLETNEADKIRGDWIDPQAGRVTFAEYTQRWQATRMDRSQWTLRQDASILRSLILPTFGERAVGSIRESEVATWLATLPSADSTRAKAIQKLSAVMALAVADSAIKSNPGFDPRRRRDGGVGGSCDQIWRPGRRSRPGDPDRRRRGVSGGAVRL